MYMSNSSISSMIETNSKLNDSTSERTDQSADIARLRFRHQRTNIPVAQPAHFVLSTDDFLSNNHEGDLSSTSKTKHKTTQIVFLVFTTFIYLMYALRIRLSSYPATLSEFWSRNVNSSLARLYTIEVRPSLLVEQYLLRIANYGQAVWLVYILSWIFRRTHLGYLYRNPDVFNSWLCLLLISAWSLQTVKHLSLPAEISSVGYLISALLLILVARQVAVKIERYNDKYRSFLSSIDLFLLRYLVLNGLFLYTTSIIYAAVSSTIECYGIYLDFRMIKPPIPLASTDLCGTISLSLALCLLLIYFCLDQFIYRNEFRSIWTPYLFILVAFLCPPLRRYVPIEQEIPKLDRNYYLLWILFSATAIMISVRLFRTIRRRCRMLRQPHLSLHLSRQQTQSAAEFQ